MSTFLFKKNVDQSLLKDGMTIPKEAHQSILNNLSNPIRRGENCAITIVIDGTNYDAKLTWVNLNSNVSTRDVLQIRYTQNTAICQKLRTTFSRSFSAISAGESITDADKETIELLAVSKDCFGLMCFPNTADTAKAAFVKYIGSENDLSGYQRSYKLVFLKSLFENWNGSGEVPAYTVSLAFQKFYIARKQKGLIPDVNVDPVIENVETSSVKSIFSLILRNPYDAISKKGFVSKIVKNEKEYFKLQEALTAELKSEDIKEILQLIDHKLSFYYSKIDPQKQVNGKMQEMINKILNEYVACKKQTFAGHSMGIFFRNEIPNGIYNTGIVDSKDYLITGSVGQGNWATVPWVCIFDRAITTSATKGVYIVYLLAKDGNTLYLTFNQGCTKIREKNSKKDTIKIMRQNAAQIAAKIDSRGFATDEDIDLGNGLTELAELYQKGTIFYKAYRKGNVPSESELQEDLAKMMDIYREYAGKTVAPVKSGTWLLTWNPNNWHWEDYDQAIAHTHSGEPYESSWTCTNTHVQPGDRVYLSVLGMQNNNGIIASGTALTQTYEDEHYNTERAAQGATAKYIDIRFDWINDYRGSGLLTQARLKEQFPNQHWSPQGSGIAIAEEYVVGLEQEWQKYMQKFGGEEELSTKDIITQVKNYIASKGFTYEDGLVENFHLSLKSKPFVILAGTSGTGKTRLVKLFAEACGATTANGRYKMVSVRPDWSDSSDLFGHVDLNGKFIPGAIIDFVKNAELDTDKPYFLCLDEMNRARVEYYLSDVLSVIETRDFISGGTITSDPLVDGTYYGSDKSAAGKYGTVTLPENLYIIGTVNMDETTFPFSRKVLDRANTIEFSFVDLAPTHKEVPKNVTALDLPNSFLKTEYLLLAQCADQQDKVDEFCVELQAMNRILQRANAHVGYRVRDEIVFYMLNNESADLLTENDAMDNEIMQKILPRIQGSSASVKKMLCELFKHCAGDFRGFQTDDSNLSDEMEKVSQKPGCKYKRSAEKIAFMVRRYEEEGFTSYWL